VHRNAALFELTRVTDHILLCKKFPDDISNSSKSYRVDKQTHRRHPQMDTTVLKTTHLTCYHCTGGNDQTAGTTYRCSMMRVECRHRKCLS